MSENQVQSITFQDKTYSVESLTEEVVNVINYIQRAEQEVAEQTYELNKTVAAKATFENTLGELLKDIPEMEQPTEE